MIRVVLIDIDNWIRSYLPWWKRQANRMRLLKALLSPIAELNLDIKGFSSKTKTRAQVSLETASVQWYLNHLFDSAQLRISIINMEPGGMDLGIESVEPSYYKWLGTQNESPPFNTPANVGFQLENTLYNGHYLVDCPLDIQSQESEIIKELELFRPANKQYLLTFN